MRKPTPSEKNGKKRPVFAKGCGFEKHTPSTISRELKIPVAKTGGKIIDFGGRSRPSAIVNAADKISRIGGGASGRQSLGSPRAWTHSGPGLTVSLVAAWA
jgi:hypothetical protein